MHIVSHFLVFQLRLAEALLQRGMKVLIFALDYLDYALAPSVDVALRYTYAGGFLHYPVDEIVPGDLACKPMWLRSSSAS